MVGGLHFCNFSDGESKPVALAVYGLKQAAGQGLTLIWLWIIDKIHRPYLFYLLDKVGVILIINICYF